MALVEFELPSGAKVEVQSSLPAPGGIREASGVVDKVKKSWGEGVALVGEVAEGLVEKLKRATKDADEVTVEFGVTISGKGTIVVVESEAAANLKVTLSWQNGRSDAAAS